MNASQRAAQQLQEAESGVFSGLGGSIVPGLGSSGSTNGSGAAGGGFANVGGSTGDGGAAIGDAWNKAKQWMGTVAEKVEGMENEVWRRVNNDK